MFTKKTKELPNPPNLKDNDSDDSVEKALRAKPPTPVKSGKSLFRQSSGKQMYLQVNSRGSVSSLSSQASDQNDTSLKPSSPIWAPNEEAKLLVTNSVHRTTLHKNNSLRAADAPEIMITKDSPRTRINKPANLQIPDSLRPGKKKQPHRKSQPESDDNITLSDLDDYSDLPLRELTTSDKNKPRPITPTTPEPSSFRKRIPYFSRGSSSKKTKTLEQLSDELDGRNVTHENGDDFSAPIRPSRGIKPIGNPFEAESNIIRLSPIHTRSKSKHSDSSHSISQTDSILNSHESDDAYLALIEKIGIERVFYNPELEIVNRVCLEYTALCASTEPRWTLLSKHEPHFSRVYEAMELRMESVSTPIIRSPPSPAIPVILAMLLLDRFRIKSDDDIDLEIQVPLLSHNHKMGKVKFEAIITQCFGRKAYYERTLDISRHKLKHLA